MNYFDKIKEALSSKLKGKELTLDSNLRDLGIDSLDVVDLIMDLEEELGIEFSDEELMSIIKGPDFPTEGIILGREGIKEAYTTGKRKNYIKSRSRN